LGRGARAPAKTDRLSPSSRPKKIRKKEGRERGKKSQSLLTSKDNSNAIEQGSIIRVLTIHAPGEMFWYLTRIVNQKIIPVLYGNIPSSTGACLP